MGILWFSHVRLWILDLPRLRLGNPSSSLSFSLRHFRVLGLVLSAGCRIEVHGGGRWWGWLLLVASCSICFLPRCVI